MSRIAKWKLEKTKVKVVFRLQFHATHIPQSGWDKLFISFIPADSGKATAKTTKANVRNGTCKWADPIYETTRLLQDTKTKRYDDKHYKLLVTMGSSRSSVLGEAIINLADYTDALKPSSIALPLQGCDSGTILHVTAQLLTSRTGFREFEQQRELREGGLQTSTDQHSLSASAGGKVSSSEEIFNNQADKVNTRVRFKPESKGLPQLEEEANLNEDYADPAIGFDGASNTSESLYAEKLDTSSTHEIDSLRSTTSGDLGGLSLSQSPRPEKGDPPDHRFLAPGTSDWVHSWGSDYSADNDLAIAYEENNRLRGSLEVAEASILELKSEVSLLQCHSHEFGAETQKFSVQLAAEIASGEELAMEVSALKSECLVLKDDLKRLKNSNLSPSFTSRGTTGTYKDNLFQDFQFRWLKGLLVIEDKIKEFQNKACFGFQELDFRFLHSDLEALLGVLQDLKQETAQPIPRLSLIPSESQQFVAGTGFGINTYQPEGMLNCLRIPGLVSLEPDSEDDATNAMKGKIIELLRELDESKSGRESLARKMEQMECYYEALIQELEENQRQMLGELQNLRNEHSTCLYTISSTKAEMETMLQEMNKQILRFAEDKRYLDSLNQELERRAISAETALKRARLNYSIAVDHLQKDLELLSFQVLSMFQTNENLIRQAFTDSSQPSFIENPEMLKNQKLDTEEFNAAKLLQCQNQCAGVKKQQLGGDILLEDLKRSLHLQEGLYRKVEEEVCEMHLVNIYLDVFSKTLQETIIEASDDIRFMKEKLDKLTQELELSTESKELLMIRLKTAMDEVHSLNEYQTTCIAKFNDMALQNQILEANLRNVTCENHLLTQKIMEWETLLIEYRSYESKYEMCAKEKSNLTNLLTKETQESDNLRNEISSLQEELKMVRTEFDELASVKENLQNIIDSLQDKLQNLLASYGKKFNGPSLGSEYICQDSKPMDLTVVVLQLEELQCDACEKILQLMEEKKGLVDERDAARVSLCAAESEILVVNQKFERDIRDMVDKLDMSNIMMEKLQLDFEVVANRLKISSEAEEKNEQQHRDLFSDLDRLEVELQQVISKNTDLAQEILVLETVTEEHGNSKLTLSEFADENQALLKSLKDKTEESSQLALELDSLKRTFWCLQDELCAERNFRDKLESTITDLTSQLNEKHCQLLDFDQKKAEVDQFKQLVSDLELEKSRVCRLLSHCEECLENCHKECASVTDLETQLSEMHEFAIAAEVRFIFTRIQYEDWTKKLVQELHSSDTQHVALQKKHVEVETLLNHCRASEVQYIEENARLVTSLDSLRSELEASIAKNRVLLGTKKTLSAELKEYKNMTDSIKAHYIEENARLAMSLDSLRSEFEVSEAQNRILHDRNSIISAELGEYKNMAENFEFRFLEDKSQHALDVASLKRMLASLEEEIDILMFSKEEAEVKVLILMAKLDEQHAQIKLLEGYNDEFMLLKNKCSELTQRLSEQTLKTEEFKNLSLHLKELKDKADAECLQAHEKREPEGPPVAVQDSLRIAFIKEQYETRLQELKQQFSISKKHSEEMLWKLQDALDEIESRKKSEATHLKKNEELGMKILELEAELQSVISDKREKMKAYDMMKAELECSLISLDCCKEEKQKLEASLQNCNEENSKIAIELTLMKELLESSTSAMNNQKEGDDASYKVDCMSDGPVFRKIDQKNAIACTSNDRRIQIDMVPRNGPTGDSYPTYMDRDRSVNTEEAENARSIPIDEGDQDVLLSKGANGIPNLTLVNQENWLDSDMKHLAVINDHFKAQSLKSSMDHLSKELEKMKNENLLLPQDNHHFYPNFPGLQSELMQLHKANEELVSIFPLFNEFSSSGNALERVLALEIELAEAFQAKKKSSFHFQSSFLKIHSDEEAVFKSFRDINELIKDMLELKGRYTDVENELKEMHDRYSQLSLQFAEVEGERQKLMMTLKNVRASKKLLQLNRPSSASLGDHYS